eukprot:7077301-Pyramimonas_sp.AAC.1
MQFTDPRLSNSIALHWTLLGLMPRNWTLWLGGVRPRMPDVMMMSLADHQTGMLSRRRFLRLTIIKASDSIGRPDWIRPSP